MEAIDYSSVPRQRLAQALRAAREMVGLDELAAADALGVSRRRLRLLEGGRRRPREDELAALCELYGLDLGGGLAHRVPIVFDADRGGIVIAGRLVRYVPGVTDNDDFLEAYVRVVRELRGLDEDTPIQLRANDLAVLAVVLDLDDDELEDRVAFWLGQPPGSQVGLRHRLVLAAVVVGVAGSATVGGIIANSHAASAQTDAGPAAVQQFDGPPGGHGHGGDGGHVGHDGPPGHDDSGGHAAPGHDAGTHVGDAAVDGGHHAIVDAGGDGHGVGHVGGLDGSTLTIDTGDGSTLSLDFSSMTGISGGFDIDLDAVDGVAPHADAGHGPAAPAADAGHAPAAPAADAGHAPAAPAADAGHAPAAPAADAGHAPAAAAADAGHAPAAPTADAGHAPTVGDAASPTGEGAITVGHGTDAGDGPLVSMPQGVDDGGATATHAGTAGTDGAPQGPDAGTGHHTSGTTDGPTTDTGTQVQPTAGDSGSGGGQAAPAGDAGTGAPLHSSDFDGARQWVRQVVEGQQVDGWTGNGVALTGSELWSPASGDTSVDMNGNGSPGQLHRTIDTEPGQQYQISFDLSGNPHGQRGVKTVDVDAGTDHASFAKDTRSISRSDMQWERVSMTFTADGPTTDITIASTTPGAVGAVIDNITITPLT